MAQDFHATGGRSQELLYDEDVATPTHAEYARTLVERVRVGTLCTLRGGGHPYGSFCTFAMDGPDPVFLISELAEHTQNLRGDPRASLLVAQAHEGDADPLANARLTLVGECRPQSGEASARARAAFLARHPGAAYYADFKDFHFWRLAVSELRYIGGYGRMSWVELEGWRAAEPDPIAGAAAGIIRHMNEDHADAMVLYCRHFSRATDTSAATMTGVDRYGFEMSAVTGAGPRPIRLAFSQPVTSSADVRRELVELVKRARALTGGASS